MKKITYIYLLVILSFVLLGVFNYFFFNVYNKISTNFKTSEKKYDLLESANSLMNSLNEAESSQRGYLITHDEEYLTFYNRSVFRVNSDKIRFYKIVNSYGLLNNNDDAVKELDFLINQKLKEMNYTITLQKRGKGEEAIAVIKSDVGVKLMKKLTNTFENLIAEQKYEETKAKLEIQTKREVIKNLNIVITIMISLVLLILTFMLNDLHKNSKILS